MTTWSSKTQPTPANIRKRITAAEQEVRGALALIDQNHRLQAKGGPRVPLDNALAWLADGFRRAR